MNFTVYNEFHNNTHGTNHNYSSVSIVSDFTPRSPL